MRNKTSILKTHTLLFFFTILTFVPRYVFALEVNYPDFIPLQETTTLSELIIILFRTSFVLAGAVAFFSLVYVGFQFIISGEKPAERQKATGRLKKVWVSIIILASSVLILQTINPSLVVLTLDDIPLEKLDVISAIPDEPEPPLPSFIAGEDYGEILFAQTLTEGAQIIEQLQNILPALLGSISNLMDECSADLCTPGGGDYNEHTGDEKCNCEDVDIDIRNPNDPSKITTITIKQCDTCPVCEPASCTADICLGEPLPNSNKNTARDAIEQAPDALDELAALLAEVQETQNEVDECVARSSQRVALTCPVANILSMGSSLTQNCNVSEDYFCGVRETGEIFEKISIPINDFIESEEALIFALEPIIINVETASCGNTSWSCGGPACGATPSGVCGGGRGCSPELFDKLDELNILKNRLQENKNVLQELVKNADEAAELVYFAQGGVILLTCQDARENYVGYVLEGDRYVNGSCLKDDVSGCCPTSSTINSVNACENIDLYLCS